MEVTDLDILTEFKKGNQDLAFSKLMKKYQERIYWHIRRMVLRHEDADDVIQNTFVKAWKGLPKFREEANLYTWLYRIATNETITFINANKKRQAQSIDEVSHILQAQKAEHYFSGDEIEIKLHQAISTLPDKQKLVFNMKYFDDMKYQDIADVLGGSVGSLKASYFHAVKKIETFLKTNDIILTKSN